MLVVAHSSKELDKLQAERLGTPRAEAVLDRDLTLAAWALPHARSIGHGARTRLGATAGHALTRALRSPHDLRELTPMSQTDPAQTRRRVNGRRRRRLMRSGLPIVLVVALVVSASLAGASSGGTTAVKGPWLLTALPSMGTVTWRCDAARERRGQPALALGLDTKRSAATQTVELRARGKRAFRRAVQPGQVVAFPFLRTLIQRLTIVQTTVPGTLRGVVVVNFRPTHLSPSHCWEHLPPAVIVSVSPR
jgi:hypothetical protein